MNRNEIIKDCQLLLDAYKTGKLGQTVMPEDSNPGFSKDDALDIAYFSLPMALNYQRNSYELWKAALKTYNDEETRIIFDVSKACKLSGSDIKITLMKYKLALQPNKHIDIWQRISQTVYQNWGSFSGLLKAAENDFLKLKGIVQKEHKKGFPYLSGAKIFNYWCFILNSYCKANLKNSEFIDIAPDTHITKCSVKLGVITEKEAETLSKEEISDKWRALLKGSGINPTDMHPPLWFWSRNGFIYKLEANENTSIYI
ncbi:MAG: hypothetical protein UT66_C0017G0003 [candidate division CPR2 bacterium GW2011_GWC1_39_9]|uniref:Uncharacterized protein n=1 Tax=candidate division CPR2 bacterium GW2011_GWC2_39_10 TaxID=1618345 RepID=A0A0G0M292_UNCC2|nr:MAG: hypothetical protein UT18_C0010G0012 [candidate division CPR2 bacterium GW2011_GWC2_39_10]KKR34724.1 MAG: hypothetical protein UT66_C0017G0003 [candidate division CPR2 bacterium GW2011_GWC1_39_9]